MDKLNSQEQAAFREDLNKIEKAVAQKGGLADVLEPENRKDKSETQGRRAANPEQPSANA